jgi:hypothetical protein
MRDDIDQQKPLVKLDLVVMRGFTHPNGTVISTRDYDGYRAILKTGAARVFLALTRGDNSYDWLDVTDQCAGHIDVVNERFLNIPNLHSSEVEDLNNELSRCRRSPHEFEILAIPQRLADETGAVSAIRGTVTIRDRKSGAKRVYETGHASTWVEQFVSDLQSGAL